MATLAGGGAISPPASSPRLPSPPPLSEDFIHPKSPSAASEDRGKLENASKVDHGAARRIRPGTRASDMAEGPPLVELTDLDSAFQLTEHLKSLHNAAMHRESSHTTVPISRDAAQKLAQPPEGVDRTLWLYELCRFLCQKLNSVLIALFADSPPCSAATCPEMRASEWQYLCAVHDPPKSCCAIDYCCHTLDWAATTLTSPKNFPSRLALAGPGLGSGHDTATHQQQARQLTNVFRRVYRIFAHAWFQHREMFWKVEGRTGLYVLFKTVCDVYQLIPEDNYTIPEEAEGLEAPTEDAHDPQLQLLKRHTALKLASEEQPKPDDQTATPGLTLNTAGSTTKRHKHSPSSGATPIQSAIEELDEDDEPKARQALIRQDTLRDDRATQQKQDEDKETNEEAPLVEISTLSSEPAKEEEDDAKTPFEEDAPVVLFETEEGLRGEDLAGAHILPTEEIEATEEPVAKTSQEPATLVEAAVKAIEEKD